MTPTTVTPWRVTYRQLLESVGPHAAAFRRSLIALLLSAILQGLALACVVPLFIAVLTRGDRPGSIHWLTLMVILSTLSLLLRWYGQGFDFTGRMADATHRLRSRLGEQMRRMPLEQIQGKRAGELNSLLLGSVDENISYTLTILNLIMVALFAPLSTAVALAFWDWRLALGLLLVFPAIIPLYRWRRPAFGRGMRKLGEANAHASADVLEYTQGLPVLRAACQAGAKAMRLQASFRNLEIIQTIGHKKGARPNIVITSVVELSLLMLLAAGISWVVIGTLDPAILAATFVVVARFAEPLATFVLYTAILELIESALERIAELNATAPLPLSEPVAEPRSFNIEFHDVGFQYAQANAPALQSFSARLPEHSLTALVGPSGSGKTTVTRLLLRHADPQQGRISIGGVDIRSIPAEQLNALISVVFQDVYLFDDTVLANIRMARPQASDGEIHAAARAACCLDFIERLPHGWQTRLGDIGGRLSGGERQRISIARALLKEAPIVILDEPTAALDTESEVAVQKAIDALVQDRTVIVIAHRLSTIAGADQIMVIEEGRRIAAGKHTELLDSCNRYRAMWNAQQRIKNWHIAR